VGNALGSELQVYKHAITESDSATKGIRRHADPGNFLYKKIYFEIEQKVETFKEILQGRSLPGTACSVLLRIKLFVCRVESTHAHCYCA